MYHERSHRCTRIRHLAQGVSGGNGRYGYAGGGRLHGADRSESVRDFATAGERRGRGPVLVLAAGGRRRARAGRQGDAQFYPGAPPGSPLDSMGGPVELPQVCAFQADDGVPTTTGVRVDPGEKHTYTIPANVPGTHLYHCH